ncbi:hypothetical protein LSS_22635 [Leptospira santarosai serovar Shermani str. LT 821]|uniref:Uncharacterized protein n=1 Tax=Leptospira santarosai serovar Shermani str. LT 821 TaxID=758847 RepID=A0A097ESW3_9LEPT|nr:hypothetical protein LSS_22635 [Leptospira santarosai serovar Shermani str. LT 821]
MFLNEKTTESPIKKRYLNLFFFSLWEKIL